MVAAKGLVGRSGMSTPAHAGVLSNNLSKGSGPMHHRSLHKAHWQRQQRQRNHYCQ